MNFDDIIPTAEKLRQEEERIILAFLQQNGIHANSLSEAQNIFDSQGLELIIKEYPIEDMAESMTIKKTLKLCKVLKQKNIELKIKRIIA